MILYTAWMAACAHYYGLYRLGLPFLETIVAVLKTGATAATVTAAVLYLWAGGGALRSRLLLYSICTVAIVIAHHGVRRLYIRRKTIGDKHRTNVLIVGAGRAGTELAECLKQSPAHRVIGFLDDYLEDHPMVLGSSGELAEIARQYFIDEIVVTVPSRRELVKKVALEARRLRLDMKVVAEMYDGIAANAPTEFLAHLPVRVLHRESIPATRWMLKRATDVIVAGGLLVFTMPLFLFIAALLKLESKAPVFYRSHRIGKKGKIFTFYKFRTMVPGADGQRANLDEHNERDSVLFKIANDPRITGMGRFLRKFSLDELPQFINVLKGDMSLVGPRPPLPSEFKQYRLDHLRRLDVLPGMTGLWQVTSRQNPSFENYMALDIEYIENWSLGADLKILLRTVPAVLKGTGA